MSSRLSRPQKGRGATEGRVQCRGLTRAAAAFRVWPRFSCAAGKHCPAGTASAEAAEPAQAPVGHGGRRLEPTGAE